MPQRAPTRSGAGIESPRVRGHIAAGYLPVPAVEVGGEERRVQLSDPVRCPPIDREVEGTDFGLPAGAVRSLQLNHPAFLISGDPRAIAEIRR